MSDTIKVSIQNVPTEGAPETTSHTIPKTGASLEEILQGASISTKNKNFYVNGSPASLSTHVGAEDKVDVKDIEVKVTERAQGS